MLPIGQPVKKENVASTRYWPHEVKRAALAQCNYTFCPDAPSLEPTPLPTVLPTPSPSVTLAPTLSCASGAFKYVASSRRRVGSWRGGLCLCRSRPYYATAEQVARSTKSHARVARTTGGVVKPTTGRPRRLNPSRIQTIRVCVARTGGGGVKATNERRASPPRRVAPPPRAR